MGLCIIKITFWIQIMSGCELNVYTDKAFNSIMHIIRGCVTSYHYALRPLGFCSFDVVLKRVIIFAFKFISEYNQM